MPVMPPHQALAVGPAAAPSLDREVTLRVHGVFASTVNLRADVTGDFVSLVGPAGAILPHAVALEQDEGFPAWGLVPGAPVARVVGGLELPAAAGPIHVDLRSARRLPARPLPIISALGGAHAACRQRLVAFQAAAGTELRLAAVEGAAAPPSVLGAALAGAVRELAGTMPAGLPAAVAALVGLGPGLTPSGDDLLAGWLAAARAGARTVLAVGLAQAVEASLPRTSELSAFLLRCAVRGFWPAPLLDVADALAAEREAEALAALGVLCTLGHSSGADLATGFLLGLARQR
jgi:hypothetical protein